MSLFMSQEKSPVLIFPGDSPLGYSLLFFALSFLTIPFLIGIVLVPLFGLYFLYQIIHCGNHWIQVKQSEIEIHYVTFTVTISRDEFVRASLKEVGLGNLSVLTLHTVSGKYYFGLIDNPKYAENLFFEFKNKTLYSDYETERHTQSAKSHDSKHSSQEPLTESERKGRELEKSVFFSLASSDEIPGDHMELWDLYVPKSDGGYAQIDVLMIHETGIHVFECKNYKGWIFGSENNMYWYQTLSTGMKSIHKEQFYNPIKQNKTHINALSNYLNLNKDYFYSSIVFGREAYLKDVPDNDDRCFITKYQNLEGLLINQINGSRIRLDVNDIARIYSVLLQCTNVSDEVKERHKQDIREKYG